MNRNLIFLDRDGALIAEKNFLHEPDDVEILPGVIIALIRLQNAGYKFVVTTNQSGVGRGYYGIDNVNAVHARISSLLAQHGIKIEGFFTCPHAPDDGCECRKPKIGLANQAMKALGFSLSDVAYVIGDKQLDMEFAVNLGVPSVLVMTGYGANEYAKGVRGLYNICGMSEAAEKILSVDGVENVK